MAQTGPTVSFFISVMRLLGRDYPDRLVPSQWLDDSLEQIRVRLGEVQELYAALPPEPAPEPEPPIELSITEEKP